MPRFKKGSSSRQFRLLCRKDPQKVHKYLTNIQDESSKISCEKPTKTFAEGMPGGMPSVAPDVPLLGTKSQDRQV